MPDCKDSLKVDEMLVNHVLAIRDIPIYRDALIAIAAEVNYGGWTGTNRIKRLLQPDRRDAPAVAYLSVLLNGRSLGPLVFISNDPQGSGDFGSVTAPLQKEGGADLLLQSMEREALVYAKHFVTLSKPAENIKTKIRDQLRFFRKEVDIPDDSAFQAPKVKYTGKSGGRKDDLCGCIQFALYWMRRIRRNGQFQQFCQAAGKRVG